MTNLSYPIKGKTAMEIAYYFTCDVEIVKKAIEQGAETYSDIYNHIRADRAVKDASACHGI